MDQERIQPLIIGSGGAGRALRHALAMYPEDVAPAAWHDRDAPLPTPDDPERQLLVVANPHALHAPRLLEAAERGYRFAISEKPVAVDREQLSALDGLPIATWICHGYRMLWGPQELARAFAEGRFGALMSVEGRYWQSSATRPPSGKAWKDSVELGGRFDVLLDLATHWVDLVTYILGSLPDTTTVRRWYVNGTPPTRDTHVHVSMGFGDAVSVGSVSKAVHGHGNTLELTIVGERASATWSFAQPDEIVWGEGGTRSTQARTTAELPARPGPFHGLGWMEGYARIVGAVVTHMRDGSPAEAPTLAEHLAVVRCLLEAAEHEADG
jgi:predicted dehydrogenase